MDTKHTAETTAPSVAPAKPAPASKPAGEPEPEKPVSSVPLSGLGDYSLEGLRAAFSVLSVGGPEGKEKEKEKQAVYMGAEEVHSGEGHGPSDEVPFEDKPVENPPSASDYPAVPSPTTTTLPATHPATSSPATTPPMAEGLGFTGMPYPTYVVIPAGTVPPMATAVSEPVASNSTYTGVPEPMPRRYDDGYHRPAAPVYMTWIPGYEAPEPGYTMPAPGFNSLSGLRGPELCCGRSRGSGRSSNRSLTRSEIREALREATSEIVGDLTQEIRAKLEPLIPPQASPTTVGVSPHPLQANHLVVGLTNTLGSLSSQPMPIPAVIRRSPFIPRTAQPPYSHVENSTRAELDRLGLTALRAMVDVEPYGCSDVGGDSFDDEPPSMTSASPSEDDEPEHPKDPSGKKKRKKRKTKRYEGRRSQEAKAIADSKILLNLPELTGKDLSEFAENFGQLLRMTGQTRASGRVKCDLLLQCCKTKYLEKQVKQIVTKSATFADVLVALERPYPTYETALSIRAEIQNLAVLPNNPKPARISELLADLDHWVGRLTPVSYGSDELLFWLVAKLPRELWDECRATAERKARALNYEDLYVLLLELALEKESDQHLNAYRPGGGGFGKQGRVYQGHRTRQGTAPENARIISNVQDLFWCDARDEQPCLLHAPDCDQRDCFLVQGKKQETNTGGKAKLPNQYRCTITCAFCGKRKHYEDECYHKQRLSAKLKTENASGKGSGKGNANKDSGQGKSKGNGKGQGGKGKGGRGGSDRKPDKDKNANPSGGNPNTMPGGNSKPSGGQPNTGPTTCCQTQAQQEQGTKRANEDRDQSNARKRSRFMRMARKLQKKGFEVTKEGL